MKNYVAAFLVLYAIISTAHAQVGINNNGAAAAGSSMLDVTSSNKGVLLPRMTSAQRKAIVNPATGLLVFDTDRQTICLFDGQEWRPLVSSTENTPPVIQRTGSGSDPQGYFGHSVAMHGDYAVVGAPRDSVAGCVYVFKKENGTWKQQAKLVASYMGSWDQFGHSVDIYEDIIVVGAPYMKVGANDKQGRVYVFKRNGNTWLQQVGLQANNGQENDEFGTAVSVYGNTIAIGAPGKDHTGFTNAGAVYIVRNTSGAWEHRLQLHAWDQYSQDYIGFGAALDLYDKTLLVGAPNSSGSGQAYTFTNTDVLGYGWSNGQKILPDALPQYGKAFGYSVAMSGDNMIIGMPKYTFYGYGEDGGIWYIYKRWSGSETWTKITSGGSQKAMTFEGNSVAVDGDTFYIGSNGWIDHDYGYPIGKGRVLIYKNNQIRYIYNVEKDVRGGLGTSVAAYNGQYIFGAPNISGNVPGTVLFGMLIE